MSSKSFIGGAWRTAASRKKYIAGAWRTAIRRKIYIGGGWKDAESFVSTLSASASPSNVARVVNSLTPVTVTSQPATVTPSGGLGPYTYSWSAPGMTPTNPTSAASGFSALLAHGDDLTADATCTVTDSLGATATATASVYLSNGA